MANKHGDFIWYELLTSEPQAAADFYGTVVGWTANKSDMPGMDYRLLHIGDHDVGGLMAITPDMAAGGAMPGWLGYVGVDDVDKMAASIADGGGTILMEPQNIPDVGRFAMVADPQGAPFYIMKPTPPADQPDAESHAFSYDHPRIGHCAWNELATSDVEGAKHFYGQRFGWVKDGEMDMGPMGAYEFLRHTGRSDGSVMGQGMLGAVMPKMPGMPVSAWTYYFRVPDIDVGVAHIEAGGGQIVQPSVEIPGGDYSLVASDPQGAHFGLVGARNR